MASTPPERFVVSRTTTTRLAVPTSTQSPPLDPLWVLLRQAVPTSTQLPPLLPL